MSSIDCYKHKLLGFIECPSSFEIVSFNPTRKVAIYELLENIPGDEEYFDGKAGDVLLGGGSGEAPALRISMPQMMLFFFRDDWDDYNEREELCKPFWTPTESYKFCDGYLKLGWLPDHLIEFWLAEELCNLLLERFDQFEIYKPINWDSASKLTFFEKDYLERHNEE